jgi:hypothetical protein
MVVRGIWVQVGNSFKDNYFTVLGFAAADGRAVMCAIVIVASKLNVTYVTGLNPLLKDAEDMSSDTMKVLQVEIEQMKDEHSNGVDRMFLFGPTCTLNGIEVICYMQQE